MIGINWTNETRNIVPGCHVASEGSVPCGSSSAGCSVMSTPVEHRERRPRNTTWFRPDTRRVSLARQRGYSASFQVTPLTTMSMAERLTP
jgi:hypothetical protein